MVLKLIFREDQIYRQATFQEGLRVYLDEQLTYSDGLHPDWFMSIENNDEFNEIMRVDHELYVHTLPKETREGTQKNGRAHVKTLLESISRLLFRKVYE